MFANIGKRGPCSQSLKLELIPFTFLESPFFKHPLVHLPSLIETPLRKVIEKRINLVYNLILLLEECLVKIENNNSQKKLKQAILLLVCELRNGKFFPTLATLV